MPVEDHPIHPSTIEKTGTKYGCWNTERKFGYTAPQRRYDAAGDFTVGSVFIRDKGTVACRYDFRSTDSKCEGCRK